MINVRLLSFCPIIIRQYLQSKSSIERDIVLKFDSSLRDIHIFGIVHWNYPRFDDIGICIERILMKYYVDNIDNRE